MSPLLQRRSRRISSQSKKSRFFEDDSADKLSQEDIKEIKIKQTDASTSRRKSAGRKDKQSDDEEEAHDGEEQAADEGDAYNNEERAAEQDEDEEFDEDAPPKITFIPLPKMRDTGGVDYEDDRLHKNTLLFLKDLKANNTRPWLKTHDGEYRRSLKDWESWVETMTAKVIEVDDTIPELPFKDVNFRIYRDIRFSNDPTPYKPHYSAAWSRTGRKGPYACYYVHIEPGECFVGGGLWQPDADSLYKLRRSIDERPRKWRRILMWDAFRSEFLPSPKKHDEQTVLKAFAKANAENALKTKPKGFTADHPDIELLKLRNFTISKRVPDSCFTSVDGQREVKRIFSRMHHFVTHLNKIVMPDLEHDGSSSEDE